MLRALGELLSRGVVTLSVCIASAFCIVGFLSLISPSPHPREKAIAEASAGCKPAIVVTRSAIGGSWPT
jgi:hypothetical protein